MLTGVAGLIRDFRANSALTVFAIRTDGVFLHNRLLLRVDDLMFLWLCHDFILRLLEVFLSLLYVREFHTHCSVGLSYFDKEFHPLVLPRLLYGPILVSGLIVTTLAFVRAV